MLFKRITCVMHLQPPDESAFSLLGSFLTAVSSSLHFPPPPRVRLSILTDWGSFAGPAPKLMVCFCSMMQKEFLRSVSRVFPVFDAAMRCDCHPQPRLNDSSPPSVDGANKLTVKCCVHVPFVNWSSLTNKIINF